MFLGDGDRGGWSVAERPASTNLQFGPTVAPPVAGREMRPNAHNKPRGLEYRMSVSVAASAATQKLGGRAPANGATSRYLV